VSASKKTSPRKSGRKTPAVNNPLRYGRIVLPVVVAGIISVLGVHLLTRAHALAYPHWCTNQLPESCMDNSGGVVARYNLVNGSSYENSNYHEYFNERILSGKCNGGKVSSSMACPFKPGSGFNTRYNNDAIIELQYGSTGYCLGTNQYGDAMLQTCGSLTTGAGADQTAMFVYNNGGGGTRGLTESVYWSNHWNQVAWLCHGVGNTLGESTNCATEAGANWGPPEL
jgi:hypothetical protein